MMRRLLVPALLVLFAVPSCVSAPASGSTQVEVSVDDPASHEAAARELIRITRSRQVLDIARRQATPMIITTVATLELPADEDREYVMRRGLRWGREFVRRELSWETLEPALVDAYMYMYTEEELRELQSIYASPAGQMLLERTPELMAQTMRMARRMMLEMQPTLRQHLASEFGLEEAETLDDTKNSDWAIDGELPAVSWPPAD